MNQYRFDDEAMNYYKCCRMAGIPFDYLDLSLEDYQSVERKPLRKTIEFIKNLDFEWRSSGGLLIIGVIGSGKSFLSFMIAKAAVYGNIPTICISLVEYLEKRRLEKIQPNLILELISQLEDSRIVIIDDFGKGYGGEGHWYGYEASTALYNIFKEGNKKAVVVNTALQPSQFIERIESSFLSRAAGYPSVIMMGDDFRTIVPTPTLNRIRNEKIDHNHCWLKHPALAEETIVNLGKSCDTCKYRFRPKLCLLRFEKHWIELEQR